MGVEDQFSDRGHEQVQKGARTKEFQYDNSEGGSRAGKGLP